MSFKVGDRVMTRTFSPKFNGLVGEIQEGTPGGVFEFIVKVSQDGIDRLLPFESSELLKFPAAKKVSDFGVSVQEVVNEVRDTLIAKNKAYGNSALEPVRVFSTADPVEQLRVRIDDKLSRLKSSLNDDNEDTVLDLMGYLVLLRIATRKQETE